MDEAFGKRLRLLREARKLSRPELARLAKLKGESAIRNLEQGKAKSPKIDTALALATALGVNVSAFFEDEPPPAQPEGATLVPLVGVVAAGEGSLEESLPGTTLNLSRVYAGCVAYQVRGNSMIEESIEDGDYVIVRISPSARNGDIVVAWLHNRGAMVKTLDDRGYLNSRDSSRVSYPFSEDNGDRILGVLVGVIRRT